MARPNILQSLARRGAPRHRLVNRTRSLVVADRIEPAFDSRTRRIGLLGREGLPLDTVMAIAPTNAIHTFGMKFPIDLLFIARDGRVVKRVLSLPARRLSGALRAFAVLEFAAGHPGVASTYPGDYLATEAHTS